MATKSPIPTGLAEKVRGVLKSCSPRDRALILFGQHTGWRAKELRVLTVGHVAAGKQIRSHVTLERRALKNGAGKRRRSVRSRTVAINPEARAALAEYLSERFASREFVYDEPLFMSRKKGGPLRRWRISLIVKRVLAAAGDSRSERYASHSLRKTFALHVYAQSKKDINLTRVALGHALITTTQLYLPVEDEAVDAVVMQLGGSGESASSAVAPGAAQAPCRGGATGWSGESDGH